MVDNKVDNLGGGGREGLTRSQRKRQDILDAAIAEFRQNGFHATGMDQLCKRANVSKRTLYNHFESKDQLFEAILNLLFERVKDAIDVEYSSSGDLKDQLMTIARKKVAISATEGVSDLMRITLPEIIHRPELAQVVLKRSEKSDAKLLAFFSAAVDDGRLKTHPPDYLSMQFTSLIKGFSFWPRLIFGISEEDPAKIEFMIEDSVEMFLNHYQL